MVRGSREGSEQVSEVQRARILAAMARVVADEGMGSVTVARVVSRAGVSRRTFYDLFTGCEDCFLAVFQDTVARASRIATGAATHASSAQWRVRVRAGLGALLAFFDEQPAAGSLLIVDALGAGPEVLERRARVLESLAQVVDEGRRETTRAKTRRGAPPPPAPPLSAEGVVGAVLSVLHARMLEHATTNRSTRKRSSRARRAPRPLIELLNPLMAIVVLPYLGQAAAAKELAQPTPRSPRAAPASARAPRSSHTPSDNPLEGLNMRLTYRTLQVLSAIATNPGASNRQIADRAGIHDQGQISKLLTRLHNLGLIHNTGDGQPKGEPNAWTLTPHGTRIQHALTHGH